MFQAIKNNFVLVYKMSMCGYNQIKNIRMPVIISFLWLSLSLSTRETEHIKVNNIDTV